MREAPVVTDPSPPSPESIEITLDVADNKASAAFWSRALGYRELYSRGAFVVLGDPGGAGPRLVLQQTTEVEGDARAHLDLRVLEPQTEVDRLRGLGAEVVRTVTDGGKHWTVMRDPHGAVFCVCRARSLEES